MTKYVDAPLVWDRGAATLTRLRSRVTSDTFDRFTVAADGTLSWGSGAAAADASVYRTAGASQPLVLATAGVARVSIANSGLVTIPQPAAATNALLLTAATSASTPTLVVRGGATPAAGGDLQQWQSVAPAVLLAVQSDGSILANNIASPPGTPTGGPVIYGESGVLKFKSTAGTVFNLGVAHKGYVNHGAVAGTARPTGFDSIEWYGTVAPTNAIAGDTWIDTT